MSSNSIKGGGNTLPIADTSTPADTRNTSNTPAPPAPTSRTGNGALSALGSHSERSSEDGSTRLSVRTRQQPGTSQASSSAAQQQQQRRLQQQRHAQHPPSRSRNMGASSRATAQEREQIGGSDAASVHSLHTMASEHESMDITEANIQMPGIEELEGQLNEAIHAFDAHIDVGALDLQLAELGHDIDIDSLPDPSTPEERAAVNSVMKLVTDITNNNFENPAGKMVASVANSFVARAASVYGPTFLRQLIGQKLGEAMSDEHLSKDVKAMIGVLLTAVPIALLVAGMMRDKANGVATNTTRNSRLALMALGGTMGLAALGTGSVAGASASLGAFVLYCAMRDGVQQFVKLAPKEDKQPTYLQSQAAGTAYAVDQMAAGSGMSYLSSPSGAGAAGQVLQSDHSAERAGWNMAGEITDDLVSSAITKGGIPELTLSFKMPSADDLKNTLTGAFPARATLFTASTLLSQIIADKSTGDSAGVQTNVNNLGVALLLGMVMYAPFAQMGNTRTPEQTGGNIQELHSSDDEGQGPILPTTANTGNQDGARRTNTA